MIFTMKINMDNDAFAHYPEIELRNCLLAVGGNILDGAVLGNVVDCNGNKVGEWKIDLENEEILDIQKISIHLTREGGSKMPLLDDVDIKSITGVQARFIMSSILKELDKNFIGASSELSPDVMLYLPAEKFDMDRIKFHQIRALGQRLWANHGVPPSYDW